MFLRMSNADGALCTTCHRLTDWASSSHATSGAAWNGSGTNPWPEGAAPTVAGNACMNCHRTHSAGHGPRLLAQGIEMENCTVCHAGSVAQKDVADQFANGSKFSRHPVDVGPWLHDPRENPLSIDTARDLRRLPQSTCVQWHARCRPRRVRSAERGARVTSDGTYLKVASNEYEVCNRCHGFTEPATPGIQRAEATRIVRVKVDPSNASFHPIAGMGRPFYYGTHVGLHRQLTHHLHRLPQRQRSGRGQQHAARTPRLALCPHPGARDYLTADPTPESTANYDLCYQCHDRGQFVTPQATGFPHAIHVVDQQAPCAVCHDAHGSRQNAHLINFMLRDQNGREVVTPNGAGQTDYVSSGVGRGSCSLRCHGADHDARSYPN